ncbi:MAG: mechanosensitive ion channel family protein [Methanoregula sp.]|jgi:small-conductance mechanosensitive channel|uniref:mechanosensitive ion channel family protein n=1 Tax=Methanoregula sp. TaxID=2052170 RepID=UPI0025E191A6|nr:mechanosensitive ion channel domain-containing protein [Methanoregula sp.]MCK9632017.1 mechanosensitive ion channel family protein [Methanoregula sp.]
MADTLLTNVTSEVASELPIKNIDVNLIVYIISIIVIAYVLTWLLSFILIHVSERIGWYRTSITMTIPLLKLLVYIVALYYIIIAVIEPSLTQMIAFSGLFGAAIGFGLKDLFADIVGGVVIIFEKPYQIGDKVTIDDKYGEVKDIGIRSTRIQTPADELVSIPNFTLFSRPVTSGNAGDLAMMIVIDLFIHPSSDAEKAMKILKEALVTSKYVIISKKYPYTVLLEDFPFYKRVRAKGYVNDLRLEFEFKSEVTRRAWGEFQKEGILPPSFVPPSGTLRGEPPQTST